MSAKPTLVQLILNAPAFAKSIMLAASASAHKTLLSLVKGDVGLGNVDNTSDVNKPVSTAQQTAIDAKIGGTLGTTANRIPSASGTGGRTLQQSPMAVDANGVVTTGGLTISPTNGAVTIGQVSGILISTENSCIIRHGNNNAVFVRPISSSGSMSTAGYGAFGFLNTSNLLGGYFTVPVDGTIAVRNGAGVDGNLTAAVITASGAVKLAQKTIATLPSAAASNGERYMVTDSAVQTGRMAYCYGSTWRYEDGSAV